MKRFSKRLHIILVLSVFVVVSAVSPVYAQSNEAFNASNNVLFYDKTIELCSSANSSSTVLTGNDAKEKVLRYYVGKGLSLVQAAAIAGNYQQESNFNPAIINNPRKVVDDNYVLQEGVAFGIAQWLWPSRQQGLMAFAKAENKKNTDLEMQLDYSWKELNDYPEYGLAELKESTDINTATQIFDTKFEQSGGAELSARQNFAKNIYDEYKDKIPDATTSELSSGMSCSGDGKASAYATGNFAIYDQFDSQWKDDKYGNGGKIGPLGCGPSAMAMIVTALHNRSVTPKQTAVVAENGGAVYYQNNVASGSIGSILVEAITSEYDLKHSVINKDIAAINTALRAGSLVLAAGVGPSPYVTQGHFIVIRAVTENGKWLIGDSNGSEGLENSNKEWDPQTLLVSTNGLWEVSK